MIKLKTPIKDEEINNLKIKDKLLINGTIYTGRDAVLPKIVKSIDEINFKHIAKNLKGSAILHTAVSEAGVSPTTSNKVEIESSMPLLSKKGVKIHIGKGSLNNETKNELNISNSIFTVTPPVAALLTNKILSKQLIAFKEEGIEAMYKLEVKDFPVIVAIAHGKSIFD
ncbi:MAG: fumarate hydratase C-terminal domain-containing protein [Methanobrevibacter sp.]|jgi:fumarate hydratase subunit beta|nr:fumarate hydratase C-terminal domain-containing protein [Methanobrevibacter sp.]